MDKIFDNYEDYEKSCKYGAQELVVIKRALNNPNFDNSDIKYIVAEPGNWKEANKIYEILSSGALSQKQKIDFKLLLDDINYWTTFEIDALKSMLMASVKYSYIKDYYVAVVNIPTYNVIKAQFVADFIINTKDEEMLKTILDANLKYEDIEYLIFCAEVGISVEEIAFIKDNLSLSQSGITVPTAYELFNYDFTNIKNAYDLCNYDTSNNVCPGMVLYLYSQGFTKVDIDHIYDKAREEMSNVINSIVYVNEQLGITPSDDLKHEYINSPIIYGNSIIDLDTLYSKISYLFIQGKDAENLLLLFLRNPSTPETIDTVINNYSSLTETQKEQIRSFNLTPDEVIDTFIHQKPQCQSTVIADLSL